jgi:isoleucyl-tRNA synthetase
MARVMICVRLGRQLRTEHNLKVRQPLAALRVASHHEAVLAELAAYQDIITDELNVKQVLFSRHETSMANLKAKADFKRLGPRLGPKVKEASKAIAALSSDDLERLAAGDVEVPLTGEDVVVERLPKDGLVVAAEGPIVVALETALSEALIREGLARELVNKIQTMRKDADLQVTQRIRVTLTADADVRAAVAAHRDYITTETLSEVGEAAPVAGAEWDLNGHPCVVAIEAL